MKKQKSFLWVISILLILFIGIIYITFSKSSKLIEEGYIASEGNAAENFAVLTASNIQLSNEQVEKLKNCSYEELMQSEENESLRKMMDNENFATNVDYAYIMIHLKGEDVKYEVTEENQDLFDAPLGTKLDIMWLLDVNVSPESASAAEAKNVKATDDIQRYSYYIEEDAVIFGEAPTHLLHASSEWGDHICGYAPLYTTEGDYIGVIGVELRTLNYQAYQHRAMMAMGILFGVTTLTLVAMFVLLYLKYRRLQQTRIYKDPLTGIYNRSYYNDRFIKTMNQKRAFNPIFALIIADIDWFKKVNDTFGHEIGDLVLIEISELLQEVFGPSHILRFGGEEFVAGIWVKDQTILKNKLEQLYELIRKRKFTSQQINVTLSLGCCIAKTEELTGWLLSGMLKAADYNLYAAKENGRNQYRIVEFNPDETYEKAGGN